MWMVRVALAVFLLSPMSALAQSGVTKTEIRSQSPEATARQMRDQLWGIFEPQDMRSKRPPRAMLRDVLLSTPVYPSSVPGICRRDMATLQFAPVDPGEWRGDANTPVRARGIDVGHQYHRVSALRDNWDEREDAWFGVAGRRACAGLKDAVFFDVADDDAARDSIRLAEALVAALAGGGVEPSCKDKQLPAGETCLGIAKRLDAGELWWTNRCDPRPGDGLTCTQANIGSLAMYIRWRRANANAPFEIVSVELFDEIVIADQLID
jgi:hypothetical protein